MKPFLLKEGTLTLNPSPAQTQEREILCDNAIFDGDQIMTLRFGVLGFGRIGKIHCHNVLSCGESAKLVAVCDPLLNKELLVGKGIPHLLTNEDEFWRTDFDAVIIASPTPKHKKHIEKAIALNRHMLCEKPLDETKEAHEDLKRLLVSSGVKLQVGFNRRFDKDFAKIAQISKEGRIGRPYLLRITSRDPGLPSLEYLKSSGGMLLDMSIHDFDMARFIMNSDVVEVYAKGEALVDSRVLEIGDIDTAVITLKFENGALAVIDNSRQAVYGYDQRMELLGSRGSLSNDNHRSTTIQMDTENGRYQQPILNFFLERYQHSYMSELLSFISSVKNDKPPKPDIDDAINALMIAQAAQQSLATNQPVKV